MIRTEQWSSDSPETNCPSRDAVMQLPVVSAGDSGICLVNVQAFNVTNETELASFFLWQHCHAFSAIRDGRAHVVVISRNDLLSDYPDNWSVGAGWKPRFKPTISRLAAFGAELIWREALRGRNIQLTFHRTERVAFTCDTDKYISIETNKYYQCLYNDIGCQVRAEPHPGPWLDAFAKPTCGSNPDQPVTILGAGGPIPTTAAERLMAKHVVTLSDVEPLHVIAARGAPHQAPGVPLPKFPTPSPHNEQVATVLSRPDLQRVLNGAATAVNCSVTRYTTNDYLVNAVGTWLVTDTAIACGVKRIVITAPQVLTLEPYIGYHSDWDVSIDAPARPGLSSYGLSKYIGQELSRICCDHFGVQGIVLLFNGISSDDSIPLIDYVTSFADTAELILAAVETKTPGIHFDVLHCPGSVPHGHFDNRRLYEILGDVKLEHLGRAWIAPTHINNITE